MKLNFWQWIGLILLVLAVVLIARKRLGTGDVVHPQQPGSTSSATTTPASATPTTIPSTSGQ